jgi:hypothetical protein
LLEERFDLRHEHHGGQQVAVERGVEPQHVPQVEPVHQLRDR